MNAKKNHRCVLEIHESTGKHARECVFHCEDCPVEAEVGEAEETRNTCGATIHLKQFRNEMKDFWEVGART